MGRGPGRRRASKSGTSEKIKNDMTKRKRTGSKRRASDEPEGPSTSKVARRSSGTSVPASAKNRTRATLSDINCSNEAPSTSNSATLHSVNDATTAAGPEGRADAGQGVDLFDFLCDEPVSAPLTSDPNPSSTDWCDELIQSLNGADGARAPGPSSSAETSAAGAKAAESGDVDEKVDLGQWNWPASAAGNSGAATATLPPVPDEVPPSAILSTFANFAEPAAQPGAGQPGDALPLRTASGPTPGFSSVPLPDGALQTLAPAPASAGPESTSAFAQELAALSAFLEGLPPPPVLGDNPPSGHVRGSLGSNTFEVPASGSAPSAAGPLPTNAAEVPLSELEDYVFPDLPASGAMQGWQPRPLERPVERHRPSAIRTATIALGLPSCGGVVTPQTEVVRRPSSAGGSLERFRARFVAPTSRTQLSVEGSAAGHGHAVALRRESAAGRARAISAASPLHYPNNAPLDTSTPNPFPQVRMPPRPDQTVIVGNTLKAQLDLPPNAFVTFSPQTAQRIQNIVQAQNGDAAYKHRSSVLRKVTETNPPRHVDDDALNIVLGSFPEWAVAHKLPRCPTHPITVAYYLGSAETPSDRQEPFEKRALWRPWLRPLRYGWDLRSLRENIVHGFEWVQSYETYLFRPGGFFQDLGQPLGENPLVAALLNGEQWTLALGSEMLKYESTLEARNGGNSAARRKWAREGRWPDIPPIFLFTGEEPKPVPASPPAPSSAALPPPLARPLPLTPNPARAPFNNAPLQASAVIQLPGLPTLHLPPIPDFADLGPREPARPDSAPPRTDQRPPPPAHVLVEQAESRARPRHPGPRSAMWVAAPQISPNRPIPEHSATTAVGLQHAGASARSAIGTSTIVGGMRGLGVISNVGGGNLPASKTPRNLVDVPAGRSRPGLPPAGTPAGTPAASSSALITLSPGDRRPAAEVRLPSVLHAGEVKHGHLLLDNGGPRSKSDPPLSKWIPHLRHYKVVARNEGVTRALLSTGSTLSEDEIFGAITALTDAEWTMPKSQSVVNDYVSAFWSFGLPAWPITPLRFAYWFIHASDKVHFSRSSGEDTARVLGRLIEALIPTVGPPKVGTTRIYTSSQFNDDILVDSVTQQCRRVSDP